MLAVDPEAEGRTSKPDTDTFWAFADTLVLVRPSQRKFPSYHNTLEIMYGDFSFVAEFSRASRFSPAHLNRQLITILSSLGIPDNVFLRYQKKMLE